MKKKEFSNGSLCNLHLRAAGEGEEKSRVIEGTAIVFGKRSINLMPGHPDRELYEVIEPSALTDELLRNSDIVLTYEHNQEAILGAWVRGKGTLKLKRTKEGLDMACELGQSTTANAATPRSGATMPTSLPTPPCPTAFSMSPFVTVLLIQTQRLRFVQPTTASRKS